MGVTTEPGSKLDQVALRLAPAGDGAATASPASLVADRFAIDGVEFVAFTWDASATATATATARPPADLTPAEADVLALVVQGASNAQIARARGVSVRTIANQVASLLRKVGAGSRYELVARHGGIRP
jgi:DNA-binding CsgD family transcriptional regulator